MRYRALLALALVLPSAVAAQAPAAPATQAMPAAPDPVMLQFERFADIFGGRLVAAFRSIPAASYDYRPTPPQQTVGYIAQHVENANYGLCGRFSSLKHRETARDSLPDSLKARWPKDTLVARLEASLRFCDTALDRAGSVQSPALAANLLGFETDLAEHYSQVSSYMRLLGLVPPSAIAPKQRTAIDLPASGMAAYVGTYRLTPGWELEVTMQHGAPYVQSSFGGPAVRLWPETQNDFFVREVDAQLTFTRDESGAVTGLVLHQYGRDRPALKIR